MGLPPWSRDMLPVCRSSQPRYQNVTLSAGPCGSLVRSLHFTALILRHWNNVTPLFQSHHWWRIYEFCIKIGLILSRRKRMQQGWGRWTGDWVSWFWSFLHQSSAGLLWSSHLTSMDHVYFLICKIGKLEWLLKIPSPPPSKKNPVSGLWLWSCTNIWIFPEGH